MDDDTPGKMVGAHRARLAAPLDLKKTSGAGGFATFKISNTFIRRGKREKSPHVHFKHGA
jgi:hypothetical protein